jgi:hypothetical protein
VCLNHLSSIMLKPTFTLQETRIDFHNRWYGKRNRAHSEYGSRETFGKTMSCIASTLKLVEKGNRCDEEFSGPVFYLRFS